MSNDQTIFAPATGSSKAGIAVFRISGKKARDVIAKLCLPPTFPLPRTASLRQIKNVTTGEVIDRAIVIFFPSPHSFTGENVVELHTHGGKANLEVMAQNLSALEGFRLAEPGEFTRRAFENGKMDLTEAEAIADLVDAETEAQRKQAFRQLEGALGALYQGWHKRLSQTVAYMEAAIDFSDEDLPHDLIQKQNGEIEAVRQEIALHLNDNRRGERLREGFSIAILGPPNAGKSSLLNALAQKEAAIVSPEAGTTRDVIEVHLDLGGYPIILADTAGLRVGANEIEKEGVKRAQKRGAEADLKIWVLDAQNPAEGKKMSELFDQNSLLVLNKVDLLKKGNGGDKQAIFFEDKDFISLSALTGFGIDQLLQKLTQEIEQRTDQQNQRGTVPLTRLRHRQALNECVHHLASVSHLSQADLRAEEMRLAMHALGRITGRVNVEDLLDIIFRDFCIGK